MAHVQNDATCCGRQFFVRSRLCLLKGCERRFHPSRPRSRYCREECRAAARQWSKASARQRYRSTEKGRSRHREQNRRYRIHRKLRAVCPPDPPHGSCEGDHKENKDGFFCRRPGCYELVCPPRRSPLQKYCKEGCRRAVWRVIERERRWRLRISTLVSALSR